IAVAHHHFARTETVRFFTEQRGEVGCLHICVEHHGLSFLHIDAASQRQPGIFPFQLFQVSMLHMDTSISPTHPSPTSKIIMRATPAAKPIVPRLMWRPWEVSGISSSTPT